MLRVVVIDDQEQFAEVVRATIGNEPDFKLVGHAANVVEGLALMANFEPDLVMVNVHLGPGDGVADIAWINDRHPKVRVVVTTAFASVPLMQRAIDANARAWHPKDAGPTRLLWLLRATGQVGFTVHPDVLHQLTAGGPLTPKHGASTPPQAVRVWESPGADVLGASRRARWDE